MGSLLEQREREAEAMRGERFSVRSFDAQGAIDGRRGREIERVVDDIGAVHVVNTGLVNAADLEERLPALGFTQSRRFTGGGRTSEDWQRKWVTPSLRRMDFYPPALYLLPNNEVQYRKSGPERVLFYCAEAPVDGGRCFLHEAARVEAEIRKSGPSGEALLEKIATLGLSIETGFLDRGDPAKASNYFQSWQERFGEEDALSTAQRQTAEYDQCWWRDGDSPGTPTLMTRIKLRGTKLDRNGQPCLRFPRIALDAPSAQNGYRRFTLGDGEELRDEEKALLRRAYLATREGARLSAGDLVVFDNVRFGHSRESFTGPREVFVAMSGEVWEDGLGAAPERAPSAEPSGFAGASPDARYEIRAALVDRDASFPMRTFDAEGDLGAAASAVRAELDRHGAVLVQRSGLGSGASLSPALLDALGFGESEAFPWGGRASGRTTRRELSRALRATDDYPPHLWLLPHNEVLYQRVMPARLLFNAIDIDDSAGGRTFVHSAERFERHLRATRAGQKLLAGLEAHGFLIEMGFLDAHDPAQAKNYFRSWQDRFETDDRDVAMSRCREATLQFDEAWWRQDEGARFATLMTRIRLPAFCRHPKTTERCLLFPRVALDGPKPENGHRLFPRGDGTPFSDAEIDALLDAFLATREGAHYRPGDVLLVDNLRYGHSREAFTGPRKVGVAMAGLVYSDDVPEAQRR